MLEIKELSFAYGKKLLLKNINLKVQTGEIVGLLGMSGVGKTTLFNLIVQKIKPQKGTITIDGTKDIANQISYMMQKDLLFEYKTIIDNVALPLIIKGIDKKTAQIKAKELLKEFNLENWKNYYPKALSGGMRQRIEILRTIAFGRSWVLLDEPFGALDVVTRQKMHQWFKQIQAENNWSTLLITHDVDEALMLCDRIYVISGQPGTITLEMDIHLDATLNYISQNQDQNYLRYKTKLLTALMKDT